MQSWMRTIGVWLRRREERKAEALLMRQFERWQEEQSALPTTKPNADVVALVRLDDIGDYLLWRNCMPAYRQFYSGKKLLLIGNKIWEPIFHALDAAYVDAFVGLDKGAYMGNADYRNAFWKEMRGLGVAELICVSRTRPLLLDDCIASACAAPLRIAIKNNFRSEIWNECSNKLYTRLIPVREERHEFQFNRYFTEQVTNSIALPDRLHLEIPGRVPHKYVICFIGASAKSKRWPLAHWIRLIRLLQRQGLKAILSGGPSDKQMSEAICSKVSVETEVGRLDLMQTLALIAGAPLLITGDTMAAHAGVGTSVPTIILANGVNASRFVAYREAGYEHVETCYTEAFRNHKGAERFTAVSSDMRSIRPEDVFARAMNLLRHPVAHG